jgi:hypothetical protein
MAFTPGVPINGYVYPFAPAAGIIGSGTIPYDLIINEAYPGIVFEPTEANGQYEVIREVNGYWWFVTNADWVDPPISQWQQNGATNPSLPAYAMVLTPSGQIIRYQGAATLAQNVNVNWVEVFAVTANGNIFTSPVTNTVGNNEPALNLNPTWNVGPGVSATGIQLNVTDESSNGASYLEYLAVNNTPEWAVNKEGVLAYGTVPFANITGPFNNITFGGTSTFTGPVVMEDGLTVTGGETVDNLNVTGTENVNTLNVSGNESVGGSLGVTGNETVGGTLGVTGLSTLSGGINTTNITASGTVTAEGVISASAIETTGTTAPLDYVGMVYTFPPFSFNNETVPFTVPFNTIPSESWNLVVTIIGSNDMGISGTVTLTPIAGLTGAPINVTIPTTGAGPGDVVFGTNGTGAKAEISIAYPSAGGNIIVFLSFVRTG